MDVKSKEMMSKKVLVVALIIIVLIAVLLEGFFLLGKHKKNNKEKKEDVKVYIYRDSDFNLKYITNMDNTPVTFSTNFNEEINVEFNQNKDKLAYLKDNNLYLYDMIKKETINKVAINVKDFLFAANDNIVYLDFNNNLYLISDIINKEKIDIDVTLINAVGLISNDILYTKESELYTYNISTKEKNYIVKDIDFEKGIDVRGRKLLYISQNAELKLFDLDTKTSIVKANDVNSVLNYNDDFSNVIYSKLGSKKTYYQLFVNDNQNDKVEKYNCIIHHFNTGKWDYDDGGNTKSDSKKKIYHIYDYFQYQTYLDEYGEVQNVTEEIYNGCKGIDTKKDLKDQIRNDTTSVQFYNYYLLKDDKEEELVKDALGYIYSNDDTVIYTKYSFSDKDKVSISSFNSLDEYKQILNINSINETKIKVNLYYSNIDKKEELIRANNNDISSLNPIIINDKIFYSIKDDESNTSLYEYDIKSRNNEVIGKNAYILLTDELGYDIIYIDNVKDSSGNLIARKNDSNIIIDTDVYVFENEELIDSDKYTISYYKNYDLESYNGTFVIKNMKNDNKIELNDCSKVFSFLNNKYLVLKDYSKVSNSASLLLYEKGKYTTLDYNIVEGKYIN